MQKSSYVYILYLYLNCLYNSAELNQNAGEGISSILYGQDSTTHTMPSNHSIYLYQAFSFFSISCIAHKDRVSPIVSAGSL